MGTPTRIPVQSQYSTYTLVTMKELRSVRRDSVGPEPQGDYKYEGNTSPLNITPNHLVRSPFRNPVPTGGIPHHLPTISVSAGGTSPVNEVQRVTVTGSTTGHFTLTFGADTTSNLLWNDSAANVQSALEALASIGTGGVSVSGNGPWDVTFQGNLGGENLAAMTSTNVDMDGSVNVSTVTQGVAALDGVQVVTASAPLGGFSILYTGTAIRDILNTMSGGEIQAKMEPYLGYGNVSVTGNAGGPWTISFTGSLSGQPVPPLTFE